MKLTLSRLIRPLARSAGYSFDRLPTLRKPVPDLSYAMKALADAVRHETGGRVSAGPFSGMKMSGANPWSSMDEAARLLGSYEEEIHPALEDAIARKPEVVVNIGSGDGYYSTGLALRLPAAKILAFDILPEAQEATRQSAELNGVSNNVEVRGQCSAEELANLVERKNALIVCDCEGFERDIFTSHRQESFASSFLLIECHDFLRSGTTEFLTEIFSPSHKVQCILEGPRNPNKYKSVASQDSVLRWLAVCEFRPTLMNWLSMIPK